MAYKFLDDVPGLLPIECGAIAAPTNFYQLPTPMSMPIRAFDPVWGSGEFIFARANGTIGQYGLCQLLPVWDSTNRNYQFNAAHVANTAGQGVTLGVAMINMTSGQYSWFQIAGISPINGTASVAAGTTVAITAAGQIGALGNGKQLLNCVSIQAATATVAKAGSTGDNGAYTIKVPNTDGLFIGGYMSGTGVGSSAIISAIDSLANVITVTVANSAAIAGTVTQTANNSTIYYNVCYYNRPFAQGQVV